MIDKLKQWMQNPESMGADAVEQLPALIEAYPYCASYKLLYTIALANTHSVSFTQQLEQTSISLPDRSKLFMLVNNGEYEWINLLLQFAKNRKLRNSADDFALINQYLEQQHVITPDGSDSTLPAISLNTSYDISKLSNLAASINDDDEDIVRNSSNEADDMDSLIDSFIEADNDGLLFVPKASKKEDELPVVDPENIREKAFLTESLAKLYVKQHKFEQALAIFSSLNLKYSKKSCYFADQIRFLEKVIAYEKEKLAQDKENKII